MAGHGCLRTPSLPGCNRPKRGRAISQLETMGFTVRIEPEHTSQEPFACAP